MRFSRRRVVVTGASRGIGRAIATAFRQEGAWVLGTRTTDGDADAEWCDEWLSADFSKPDDIERCAARLAKTGADVLVNNAGINRNAPFLEVDPEDFSRIQRVNVYAPFRLCQAVIPSMRDKRWGRIVNLSSIFGKVSKEHRASYSASKFALDGMTVAIAAEFAAEGILANSIAPGFIDTDLTHRMLGDEGIARLTATVPARRLGQADEIARLVLFLASSDNSFITGQNIAIDGGFTRV
jgi:NAD(P)-dependent dehydrogenase (short-subunit alcohol dehydrogenase family)